MEKNRSRQDMALKATEGCSNACVRRGYGRARVSTCSDLPSVAQITHASGIVPDGPEPPLTRHAMADVII
jgi:hypothetical protein